MLRLTALRATRGALKPRVFRPVTLARTVQRFESNLPPLEPEKHAAARKAAQEVSDNLQRDWDAKIITYEELLPKTQSPSADSYLIDVREPDEVIQGMIPSAVNLPLSVLPNSLQLQPEMFQAKHGFSKPQKSQEVTFYCRSGKRSTSASDVAKRNGFTNILNYTGSWLEWVEKGGEKQGGKSN
ncbi:Rhodanese-like domain-containing protein [Favolaschia claudopus]|uniref:Rhodanese-like domain-containing protein n=1 Tax=Favolaschia claudopus TaxID=2862362 RepID=A0AAW0EI44_9AGAR